MGYDPRDFCEIYAESYNKVAALEAALPAIEADYVEKQVKASYWRAVAADASRAAAEGIPAASVPDQLRQSGEAEYASSVALNSHKLDLDAARAERRRCVERALDRMGEAARKELAEMWERYDAGKAQMEQAAADERALIAEFSAVLTGVVGYDRSAASYGVAIRAA